MRSTLLGSLFASLLTLAACTMPGAPADSDRLETSAGARTAPSAQPAPRAVVQPSTPPAHRAPPMSTPLPPEALPTARTAARLDTSCRTSADCVVKNVGNCCGAMPACVNAKSPTDPAAVKAQCERQGMMSTCGFKEVQSCSCVAGTCQDAGGPGASVAQ